MNLTPEQQETFWKGAGCERINYQRCSCHPNNIGSYWHTPDGDYLPTMPDIDDLNALITIALPKAVEKLQNEHIWTVSRSTHYIFQAWEIESKGQLPTASALVAVLYPILTGEELR